MAKDFDTQKPTFNPDGLYAYTWPGCSERVVSGTVLALLVKGADPDKLGIREVAPVLAAGVGGAGGSSEPVTVDSADTEPQSVRKVPRP